MIARTTYQSFFSAILLGLVLSVLLALTPLIDRSVTVDVGNEGPFLAEGQTTAVHALFGYHFPESADGISYRWTESWARLSFPNGHRLGDRLRLHLWLCGCHPDGKQPTVQLSLDNRRIVALDTSGTYRHYIVMAPPNSNGASDVFIEMRMPTVSFDGRQIGVRLDRVDLRAAPTPALPWPQPLALGVSAVLIMLVIMHLQSDLPVRLTLLGALIFGPAIILGFYRHQELAPATLVLATLCGLLLVASVRAGRPAIALPLAALVIALPLLPQLLGGWMVDDAFISFRYAQHLVEGYGLVFNLGERVEGYTNFLWTILMAAVIWIGEDPAYVARLLTLLIAQATIVLCYAIGRRIASDQQRDLREHPALLAAPVLLATSGPFLLYSARGSGLEAALFTLLLLAGVWAYIAGHWRLCGALLALATLTRPEGALVQTITTCSLFLRTEAPQRRSRAVAQLGAFMLIFLPYYLWRFAYYGLPFPNTFYAKVGASGAQVLRGIRYIAEYWAAEGWAWELGLTALVVASFARTRYRRPTTDDKEISRQADGETASDTRHVSRFTFHVSRRTSQGWVSHPHAYVTLIALAYIAYIAVVGGDWLPEARFVVPLIPLFALLAQAGLIRLAGYGRWGAALAVALLILAVFDHTRHALTTSAYDPSNAVGREKDTVLRRREVGQWLRDNTPPETLVAVEAAGALPYYSQRPAIDILGLSDRHIASLDVATIGQGKPGHEKIDIPYVLARRPDIIPYFSAPYFTKQPLFHRDYILEEHDGPEGYTVILYRRRTP